jgi:hypothetical protein
MTEPLNSPLNGRVVVLRSVERKALSASVDSIAGDKSPDGPRLNSSVHADFVPETTSTPRASSASGAANCPTPPQRSTTTVVPDQSERIPLSRGARGEPDADVESRRQIARFDKASLHEHAHIGAGSGGQRHASASACDGDLKFPVCRGSVARSARHLPSWSIVPRQCCCHRRPRCIVR